MKELLLKALKNKYKNLGLGEKAFDGVATFLSTSVKEEKDIETAVSGVEGLLKSFQSDSDKTRSEKAAAEKRLAEIEEKLKGLNGEKEPKKQPETKVPEDTPEWGKKLLENYEKLTKDFTTLKGERTTSTRSAQLNSIIKDLPEKLQKPYSRIPISDMSDEDFDNLTTEIKTEVSSIIEDTKASGAVFTIPSTTGAQHADVKEATKEETEAVISGFKI